MSFTPVSPQCQNSASSPVPGAGGGQERYPCSAQDAHRNKHSLGFGSGANNAVKSVDAQTPAHPTIVSDNLNEAVERQAAGGAKWAAGLTGGADAGAGTSSASGATGVGAQRLFCVTQFLNFFSAFNSRLASILMSSSDSRCIDSSLDVCFRDFHTHRHTILEDSGSEKSPTQPGSTRTTGSASSEAIEAAWGYTSSLVGISSYLGALTSGELSRSIHAAKMVLGKNFRPKATESSQALPHDAAPHSETANLKTQTQAQADVPTDTPTQPQTHSQTNATSTAFDMFCTLTADEYQRQMGAMSYVGIEFFDQMRTSCRLIDLILSPADIIRQNVLAYLDRVSGTYMEFVKLAPRDHVSQLTSVVPHSSTQPHTLYSFKNIVRLAETSQSKMILIGILLMTLRDSTRAQEFVDLRNCAPHVQNSVLVFLQKWLEPQSNMFANHTYHQGNFMNDLAAWATCGVLELVRMVFWSVKRMTPEDRAAHHSGGTAGGAIVYGVRGGVFQTPPSSAEHPARALVQLQPAQPAPRLESVDNDVCGACVDSGDTEMDTLGQKRARTDEQ